MSLKVVFASNNQHKFNEIKSILKSYIILKDSKFLMPKDLRIDFNPVEDAMSFAENASIKSHTIFRELKENNINTSDFLIIADDSGICVEALDFNPGIHSARFASMNLVNNEIDTNRENLQNSSDKENREKLKNELQNLNLWGSRAYFECAISCIFNNQEKIYNSQTKGLVSINECGENGFGYDSMFYLDDINPDFSDFKQAQILQHSIAKLSQLEKNKISHRGKAIAKLVYDLEKS